jgi:DNA helicase IV
MDQGWLDEPWGRGPRGSEGAAVEGHPELEAEQAQVDRAYERLDVLRAHTQELLASVLDQGRGGTFQFREERDVIVRTSLARLEQLDVGEQALCFGRIDRISGTGPGTGGSEGGAGDGEHREVESFHIGRLGVSAEDLEPLVVDWRAPVSEPFYRATGRDPMGLVLRRHLASSGRRVIGIEDERFAITDAAPRGSGRGGGPVSDTSSVTHVGVEGREEEPGEGVLDADLEQEIGGPGALLAAIGSARGGHMRDIVATIQREQDEIIRAALPGVLVVQGGPGTGKTAVALHRAAYLLYTHRFPLERQGVLVIGPNPLFLRYIEHVLPSLGESGVTLSTVRGLVHGVEVRAQDRVEVARLKGEARMAEVVARAVRTRQRALRRDVVIPYGATALRLEAEVTAAIVAMARRRPGTHNSRRRLVDQMVVRRLADEYLRTLALHGDAGRLNAFVVTERPEREATAPRPGGNAPASENGGVRGPLPDANGHAPEPHGDGLGADVQSGFDFRAFWRGLRRIPELSEALDRIWPRLSAEELLHDLFGSRALIALAGKGLLSAEEQASLRRPRSPSSSEIPWTPADLALIDEARVLLGPRRERPANGDGEHEEGPRTYGHIVVDEAQDLSPTELRMVSRRSLSGSVTAVGDIGQATGPWAPSSWDEVTAHLPANRQARTVGLSVSYRTPAEVVEVAARLLAEAVPGLAPPIPVRRTGVPPRFEFVSPDELARTVVQVASDLMTEVLPGTTAVLAPPSVVGDLTAALDAIGVESADPSREGLGAPLSLLPTDLANGLEFDAVVVVEPAAVVEESAQGLRTLYMALTRPTRRLTVVHSRPLPAALSA